VDLQPARARLDDVLDGRSDVRAGARLQSQVHGKIFEREVRPLHHVGRLLEAGRDEGRHPRGQRDGNQGRRDEVDVAVEGARRRDESETVHRPGARPDHELDTIHDVRAARSSDAGDAPVLNSDVGLDHAEQGIDHDDAGDDHVELAVRRRVVELSLPRAEVLGVPPHRLVARAEVIGLDLDPQVCVTEPNAIASRGPVPVDVLGARELHVGRDITSRTHDAQPASRRTSVRVPASFYNPATADPTRPGTPR
jgi:hypothetical protein